MTRILVVEDSPVQALEIANTLEKAGMVAVLAEDGRQALELLQQEDFDLVLSDIQMPGMSGYELCRKIRGNAHTRTLPVILLTILNSPADILRGLDALADNYVTKPCEPQYLIDRILSTLANRPVPVQRGVSVGLQITMHRETYTLGADLEKTLNFLLTTIEECMRMRQQQHDQRLAEETQRFFKLSLDMLAVVGEDGHFRRVNLAWESLLGLTAQDLSGRSWLDFVHPDEQVSVRARMVSGGTSFETRFRSHDGSYRRLLWSAAPVTADRVCYIAARDITYRANQEDAARLRARLQTAIAGLGQSALVETDLETLKNLCSRTVCEALDADDCTLVKLQPDGTLLLQEGDTWPGSPGGRESLAGYTFTIAERLADDPHTRDCSNPSLASGISAIIPGRDRPYGVLAAHSLQQRVFAAEETAFVEAVASILASAIARSGAEEELRESEERNRLLLESTAEAIYGIDLEGVCTFCNPAALQLLSYQRADELLGQNMHQLIHHSREDRSPYPVSVCPIEKGVVAHVDDEVLWRADGTCFYAEYWSYPVCRNGVRVGGVVTFLDITGRRLLEQQFRHAQKMEAVGRLAGGIAHDVNNLLTVVAGYCTLLEQDELIVSPDGREMLSEINKAASRATGLTRQLLSFSRRRVTRPAVADLNTVVRDVDKLLNRLIGSDIELVTELAPAL